MSSSVAAQSQPVAPPKGTRRVAVTVLLVVMLVAAAAFGATMIMAGGIQGVSDLLFGTVSNATTGSVVKAPKSGAPAGVPSTPTAGSATATASAAATGTVKQPSSTAKVSAAAVSGPSATRMYNEQAGSQAAILKLVNNGISSMSFGRPSVSTRSARIPMSANLRSGGGIGGTMALTKSGANWYFSSLGDVNGAPGLPFDSGVVSAITKSQATPEAQDAVSELLAGKIKSLKITGVSKGSGTASVNCVITGSGEYAGKRCRFTCIKKTSSATEYWFISRFAWN